MPGHLLPQKVEKMDYQVVRNCSQSDRTHIKKEVGKITERIKENILHVSIYIVAAKLSPKY